MNKKSIFISAEIFPPEIGGPATYTLNLANELIKKDFKVRILCYGKPDKTNLDKKIKINFVLQKWPTPIKYFLYFIKLLFLSLKFNTIYSMGPVSSGFPAFWVKKITNKRLIIKVVGDYAWEQAIQSEVHGTKKMIGDFQNEKLSGKFKKLQKIERKVCQNADLIITPSEYLKRIVQKWGVEERKIKVIYNSVSKIDINKENKNSNLIISVGRLVSWKGFDLLIEIMPELLKINPDFKLLICGSGPAKQNLQNLISKLKLENNVEIKKLSHQKVLKYLSKSEIFVLNTGYEGLSHAILEAMFVGTPIITTNIGGNPELIKNNESGILIEYNSESSGEQLKNAILKLHNNRELQQEFIQNAKKDLDKFDFENMINKTIKTLE